MWAWDIDFLFIIESGYIVAYGYFGKIDHVGVRRVVGTHVVVDLVLDYKFLVHFFKTFHVPRNIIFQIFYTADLKDHIFIDGISETSLSFGLDIWQLLTNASVLQKIFFDCMVITVDRLHQDGFSACKMFL